MISVFEAISKEIAEFTGAESRCTDGDTALNQLGIDTATDLIQIIHGVRQRIPGIQLPTVDLLFPVPKEKRQNPGTMKIGEFVNYYKNLVKSQ